MQLPVCQTEETQGCLDRTLSGPGVQRSTHCDVIHVVVRAGTRTGTYQGAAATRTDSLDE